MPYQLRILSNCLCLCAASTVITFVSNAEAADWTVQKASGQVWVISDKASPAVLGKKAVLTSGETLQTGPNGRVFLVRDEETILVTPNTVISLPGEATGSAMTRILQQAGSIVVKAQKRDVEHFQIETPYLAAIVKGTEFVVTLEPGTADVEVITGEVEVADYKSGEVASIKQGQAARSQGDVGLKLRGTGIFNLIRKGEPIKAVLELIKVPKNGLRAPLRKAGRVVRTLGNTLGRSLNATTRAAMSVPSMIGALLNPPRRGNR
jgi:hypothetical protein